MGFLKKRILLIYWLLAIITSLGYYFQHPIIAITKPMLVPVLFGYLLLKDHYIGTPIGKLFFYIGMIFAFIGDVFLIIISDTFFLTGMIAFIFTNLCYGISLFYLNQRKIYSHSSMIMAYGFLLLLGYFYWHLLGKELKEYQIPVLIYMASLSFLFLMSVNLSGNAKLRKVAINYFIPGAVVYLMQNLILSINKFLPGGVGDNNGLSMFTYCVAQYFIVNGIYWAYIYQIKRRNV